MNIRSFGVLVCLLLVMVGTVHAASVIEIDSGRADESLLEVKVSGIASATSIQFDLAYDPDIVQIASISKADDYQGVSMTTNMNTPGTARVLVIFPDPVTIASPDGVVLVSFSSVAAGTTPLSLSNARWSDFPAFASIEFDDVNGGEIASTIAPGATPSPTSQPSSSGGGSGVASPAPVTTYDPGDFFTSDDPVELPALPESTAAPTVTPIPDLTSDPVVPGEEPAVPEPTPAPLSVACISGLFMIPFIRKIMKYK
ncbi:hypothetical protein RJ53_04715 [Methanocalculus chunghsingensis]|uniref:Cohesin domain-containing protein n=1 Tax=Methanocalculus chunghsingensis TaxID=156457 RepID=A0A8J7W913_9EURY|nr:cohesin domain-containing protein [Methanocalculus chunghsingensis]MBR1368850.1 hypothetical protein [Methanocalculus chunghsingensis]